MAQSRVNQTQQGPTRPIDTPAPEPWFDWLDPRGHWLRLLLVFVPLAIVLRFTGAPSLVLFLVSGAAILPLAGLLGEATEQVAGRLGPGLGGLMNATFGNAAELIIALIALSKGPKFDSVVKASLTGSIIGNLLLVLGAAVVAGGIKAPALRFNRTAAGVGATMMCLAAMGLLIPALFHSLPGIDAQDANLEHRLSLGVCVILMITYLMHLWFSLVTHRDLYNPEGDGDGPEHSAPSHHQGPGWSTRKAVSLLLGATAFVALISEILVGTLEATSHQLGWTETFVGVGVVALVGNAAEHSTAILVALRRQGDLALGIALGSALQIALFVAPVLVFASYLRSEPMDLLFTTLEVVAVILACLAARFVAEDGEANWLEGAMLLMLYAILMVAFFVLPHDAEQKAHGATRVGAAPPALGAAP